MTKLIPQVDKWFTAFLSQLDTQDTFFEFLVSMDFPSTKCEESEKGTPAAGTWGSLAQ